MPGEPRYEWGRASPQASTQSPGWAEERLGLVGRWKSSSPAFVPQILCQRVPPDWLWFTVLCYVFGEVKFTGSTPKCLQLHSPGHLYLPALCNCHLFPVTDASSP